MIRKNDVSWAAKFPAMSGRMLQAHGLIISRVCYEPAPAAPICSAPQGDAFNITVQLQDFHHLTLWKDGVLAFEGGRPAASVMIADMRADWRCQIRSAMDMVQLWLPIADLLRYSEENGRPMLRELSCPQGWTDPVLFGLSKALLPALEQAESADPLFVEQLSLALLTHLTQSYGGVYFPADRRGTLAPWQEKRALEFLKSNISGGFSIAELSAVCDLNRSYFLAAFRASFGVTPVRWLNQYRVAQARELLRKDMAIAEVAIACGFADQSHLTRMFVAAVGETPARYRRRLAGGVSE